MTVYVVVESKLVHEENEGVQFGSWSEDWHTYIQGVCLKYPDFYEFEEFPIDAEVNDHVDVLWITYSTGDTFGRAEGKGEALWVFKNPNAAREALETWVAECRKKNPSITFKDDDGQPRRLSNPASGYFEDIGYVELQSFRVVDSFKI